MREITKTYLHLKVAHLDADEQALIVIDQPKGCAPRMKVEGESSIVTCSEDHRLIVGTKREVENKIKQIKRANRPRDEHGRFKKI